ncbi:MAG: Gfo/Idh/MocA family protein [Spirochaetales bacterium]
MKDKIRIGIVGLGHIADAHIQGLKNNSDKYEIYATCDSMADRKSIADELGCIFYNDYKKLAKDKNIDIILILTPPTTHYEIALEMLQNKKHTIIEKPGVVDINHLYHLIEVAKENGVTVDVIFHWCFGSEVLYLKDHFKEYGKLLRVESNVFDPYTDKNGQIKDERVDLNGAWNDSGINVLSMLSNFLDIKKIKLDNERIEYDPIYELPVYASKKYLYEDVEILISADWRQNRNHKYTNFFFENGTLFVHHTAQDIWFNAKRVATFYSENRLNSHYTNLFRIYDLKTTEHENTILLHKLLLQTLKKKM